MSSKNPVQPNGYDKEEAWAHAENQKRIDELRKKREEEEAHAAAEAAEGDDDDDEPGLHHYAYGRHAEPDSDD